MADVRGGFSVKAVFCLIGVQLIFLVTLSRIGSNSVRQPDRGRGGFLEETAPLSDGVLMLATSKTLRQRNAAQSLEASRAASSQKVLVHQRMATLLAASDKEPVKLFELLSDALEMQKSMAARGAGEKTAESPEARARRLDLLARALSLRAEAREHAETEERAATEECGGEKGPCWTKEEHAAAAAVPQPEYPFEPLLDEDYIFDSDNYLEDWMTKKFGPVGGRPPGEPPPPWPANGGYAPAWADVGVEVTDRTDGKKGKIVSNDPWKVKWQPGDHESLIWTWMSLTHKEIPTPPPTTTTTEETTTEKPTTTTEHKELPTPPPTTTTTEETTTEEPTTTTEAPVSNLFASTCYTHLDPRVTESLLQSRPAPAGTTCLFGVMDEDEGSHCNLQDGARYGSFGWCYTKEDKSEWGSCSENCPLQGSNKVLSVRIEQLSKRLRSILKKLKKLPGKSS